LVVNFVEAPSHEPLDRINRVLRIGDRLALGHLAYKPLAVLGERNDRGGRSSALLIGDNLGLPTFHHGPAAFGRAQINTDNLCHSPSPDSGRSRPEGLYDLP